MSIFSDDDLSKLFRYSLPVMVSVSLTGTPENLQAALAAIQEASRLTILTAADINKPRSLAGGKYRLDFEMLISEDDNQEVN